MSSKIKITGVSEIVKKLEKMNADVEKAVVDAVKESSKPVENELLAYIREHKYSGLTEESYVAEFRSEKGKSYVRIGFSVRDGGIAAIFLNYGTPRMAPSYFIQHALDKYEGQINSSVQRALKELYERS